MSIKNKNRVWTAFDGCKEKLKDMETEHLLNAYRKLLRVLVREELAKRLECPTKASSTLYIPFRGEINRFRVKVSPIPYAFEQADGASVATWANRLHDEIIRRGLRVPEYPEATIKVMDEMGRIEPVRTARLSLNARINERGQKALRRKKLTEARDEAIRQIQLKAEIAANNINIEFKKAMEELH